MELLRRVPAILVRAALCGVLAGGALACVPDLDTDESTVDAARVLAVVAEPAEAKPGAEVSYSALLVDASGTRSDGVLAWFYCLAQKPLAELSPIDPSCLSPSTGKLTKIGGGLAVTGKLPSTACALFGPNIPPPQEGQEPGRPVDPDGTGGYNQPIMLGFNAGQGEDLVLYEQRISCDLAGVSAQLSAEYRQRYHANVNPSVRDLIATRADGERIRLRAGAALEVSAGEKLTLQARWEECPERDVCGDGVCGPDESQPSCAEDCQPASGCGGQERYLWLDTESRELLVRRESLRLAWYGNAGTYEEERTGVDEGELQTQSSNVWTAPDEAGDATLWVVLRDARGGVGTFELAVAVR